MSDIDSDIDYEEDEFIQNWGLLQEEIVDKNYDKTDFINFCLFKKENGDDLNEWTLEELKISYVNFKNPKHYQEIHPKIIG